MNELKVFENPAFGQVRTIEIDNEPWFVGKDVAVALGYSDTKSAISDHIDAEDKTLIQRGQIATLEIPNRGLTIINESGLYSLILSSKLPKAKAFKRWMTHEVIPSIRKNGAYLTPEAAYKMLSDPQNLIQLLTTLSEKNEEVKLLTSESAEKDRKIAALENECDIRRRQTIKYCAKAMYADAAIGKGENLTIRETAKELGVKESDFTKMLVDRKYLYRRASKQNRLFPYATPKCHGVFVVKEIEFGNGLMFQSQTLVTPIGRAKLTAECVMAGLIKTMPEEHDVLEVW